MGPQSDLPRWRQNGVCLFKHLSEYGKLLYRISCLNPIDIESESDWIESLACESESSQTGASLPIPSPIYVFISPLSISRTNTGLCFIQHLASLTHTHAHTHTCTHTHTGTLISHAVYAVSMVRHVGQGCVVWDDCRGMNRVEWRRVELETSQHFKLGRLVDVLF